MNNAIKTITISTAFTIARIIMVPFIIISMVRQDWVAACILFSLAAFTDVIDGTLARLLNEETKLGAYLDPLADKILLLSCYGTLLFINLSEFKIPRWFFAIILAKEFCLIVGSAYLGLIKKQINIVPTKLGKMATVLQVLFIWWLFLTIFFGIVCVKIHFLFLLGVIVLALAAFFQYLYIGYKGIKS